MNDIMKIVVKAVVVSDILLKGMTKTIRNKTERKRRIFKYVVWYFR